MKAIVYNKKTRPKLVYCYVDKPFPNDDELLIKINAVSLNAADYRSMKMGIIPKKKIFGADIAGIVESTGKNIQSYKPGDEVFGDLADYGFGGLAEYALAPERLIAHKPANSTFEEAAALPMAAQTALQGLRNEGKIKEGDKVLIIGSGGGVGSYAIQLAKHFGAKITAVCSTKNIDKARSLGADYTIDYTKYNFLKDNKQYDLILAINGNYSLTGCKRILKPSGEYIVIGGSLSQIFKTMLLGRLLSTGNKKLSILSTKTNSADLEFISELANNKKIKPVIENLYPLDKTAEAMQYLSKGHSKGKIVITI